jgi:signal transduction histidine kinase
VTEYHEDFPQALAVEEDRNASIFHRFFYAHPSPYLIIAIALGLLGSFEYLNAITGLYAISYFYAIPVVLTTWFVGRRAGFLIMIITIIAWLFDDLRGATPGLHPILAYYNAITRFCLLTAAVMLLSAFKDLSTHLTMIVEDRTKTLRRLAAQLSEAEDLERRRLAHDIHDGFSQMLSVLKLGLATTLSDRESGTIQWNRINDAIGIVNDLIEKSRTLTFDLHPAMLEHLGLIPTLRRYGEQFAHQTAIEVTFNEEGNPQQLPAIMTNYIFRAIKELLNNSAKHGHAKQIIASLYWTPTMLRIVVDDDGSGFEPAVVLAPGSMRGMGLASIRERVGSFGGNVRIESNAQTGTRAVLEVPIARQEKHE